MNRNESGKYRHTSKAVTMTSASGRSPKKLMAVSVTPIWISRALTEPENGSSSRTQVNATAMTGAT